MIREAAIFLMLGLGLVNAKYTAFKWSDCGTDPRVRLEEVSVTPMPILLPGKLHLTVRGQVDNVTFSSIAVDLHLKRETFIIDLPVPCLMHIGSCTYENTCPGAPVLDELIQHNYAGVTASLAQQFKDLLATLPGAHLETCPSMISALDIKDAVIDLPKIPKILSIFADGDYKAKVTVRDTQHQKTIICLEMHMTMHTDR